jgi:hypothetical protein
MVRRAHHLPDAHVGVSNDAADRADDRNVREPLAPLLDPLQGRTVQPESH